MNKLKLTLYGTLYAQPEEWTDAWNSNIPKWQR